MVFQTPLLNPYGSMDFRASYCIQLIVGLVSFGLVLFSQKDAVFHTHSYWVGRI